MAVDVSADPVGKVVRVSGGADIVTSGVIADPCNDNAGDVAGMRGDSNG